MLFRLRISHGVAAVVVLGAATTDSASAIQPAWRISLIRHPGYMSFLGLVWFTPDMTIDRAMLVAIWTAYIFLGSRLKDMRLYHYLGSTYSAYRSRVPAYVPLPSVRAALSLGGARESGHC